MSEKVTMSSAVMSCDEKGEPHDFHYLSTSKRTYSVSYQTEFFRSDFFYCSKCLKEVEIKKYDASRDMPDWYRAKRINPGE